MSRFIRSVASAGALLVATFTAGVSLAQSVDPALAGHWQVSSSTGITASAVLDTTAKLSGNLSGTTTSGLNLNGCGFLGWVPAEQVNVNLPMRFSGEAIGLMIGCADRSLNQAYKV